MHCKFTNFPALLQAFSKPETTYGNFLPLMATYPAKMFARLTRRTFLPVEVSAIYASLGEP